MPNEFTKWQKQSARDSTPRQPYDAKFRAAHATIARPKSTTNPYKKEAERDKILFRWIMAAILLISLVSFIVYLAIFKYGSGQGE